MHRLAEFGLPGKVGGEFEDALPGGHSAGRVIQFTSENHAQIVVGVDVLRIVLDSMAKSVDRLLGTTDATQGYTHVGADVGIDRLFFESKLVVFDRLIVITGVEEGMAQLDAAFDLKESLETDLRSTQERLADESSTRLELQAQVDLLEAQADLAEQLREEISFVKEEQNVLTRKLEETSSRANRLSTDRETFAEQLGVSETKVKELQRDKIDIEAQLFTLKDRVKEFDEATETRQILEEKTQKPKHTIDL